MRCKTNCHKNCFVDTSRFKQRVFWKRDRMFSEFWSFCSKREHNYLLKFTSGLLFSSRLGKFAHNNCHFLSELFVRYSDLVARFWLFLKSYDKIVWLKFHLIKFNCSNTPLANTFTEMCNAVEFLMTFFSFGNKIVILCYIINITTTIIF